MKETVVYYSHSGNTAEAAANIAKLRNAECIRLTTKRQEKGKFSFMGDAFRAIRKKPEKLAANYAEQIQPYDRIYLGTPIWASNGTPAVNAFLKETRLDGKEVIVFTLQADPEHDKSNEVHQYLKGLIEKSGGKMIKALAFTGNDVNKPPVPENIRKQIEKADLG